jgi:ATP-binding cassette subfamily F protein uup
MPLLRLSNLCIAYGTHALLDHADLQLDPGERVGLLGRNGEGKSTLMKIIAGEVHADHGEVWREPQLKLATLAQTPNLVAEATIYQAVASSLGDLGRCLSRYHELLLTLDGDNPAALAELGRLQHELETHQGWHFQQRVDTILSKLNLPAEVKISDLSGGWQRRVALAQALVTEPQLLLLDEPTNHLDFANISWLEEQLLNFQGAVLFVTHDRAFLQKLATRIVDLDRGKLVSWPGNYADYLRRKAAALADEANQAAEFDKKLAQEEVWIRQGIKARRTRNEGRVRALEQLRRERAQRRNVQGVSKLTLERAETSGKKVIEINNLSFSYHDQLIIDNFSALIQRGDKIGLIGANGAGKSTLLKCLLQQLTPTQGTVEHGTKLQVAYFDQLREQLDPDMTVVDTVAEGNDFIEINGNRRHVMSYLSDFLFTPARSRSPVKSLSGGEKNRLLLARLFTRPANVIIMDEPTNDLDLETLELLEEKLVDFNGTLLIVSHDREFLDNVVTSVFVFEGSGVISEFVGGYSDWLNYQQQQVKEIAGDKKSGSIEAKTKLAAVKKRKLSYKEQKELAEMPEIIEALENSHTALEAQLNHPEFYQQLPAITAKILTELKQSEQQLEAAFERWHELEALTKE